MPSLVQKAKIAARAKGEKAKKKHRTKKKILKKKKKLGGEDERSTRMRAKNARLSPATNPKNKGSPVEAAKHAGVQLEGVYSGSTAGRKKVRTRKKCDSEKSAK